MVTSIRTKALLIYPAFPETFWSFKHALRFIRKRAPHPPLGLLTVAGLLPDDWDLRLVDLNVQPLKEEDLRWADYALIGGMTVQRKSARETIARCKAAGVTIVAGGPLFTIEHESFREEVDHLVLNEAEITLPAFLADLRRGAARPLYTSAEHADLHETPPPRWDLLDQSQYASMSIQSSRGCPYNCDFCNVTALFGRRPRTKTAEQLLAELDSLCQTGWRGVVFFVDDNFMANKKYIKTELLPALVAWRKGKRGLMFHTQISINLADDEDLLELMAQAGFRCVFIGIETPAEESLAGCSKNQNLKRDLVSDVKRIQRAGLEVQGGFIVGFDEDAPSIFQRQIDFIQQSGIVTAMVGLLQAPPGTRLHERLQQAGRLLEHLSGDNTDGSTNVIPMMNMESLSAGYRRILEHIYSPENYYQRVKTFLGEYRPTPLKAPWTREHLRRSVLALWGSVYRMGILDRGRIHYWRFLAWTLRRRPALLPQAIEFTIYGYHFRRVFRIREPAPAA